MKGDRGLRTSHPEPLRGCGLVGRADKVLGTESLVGGAIEELCLSEVGGSTRCWEWSKVRLGSQLTETPVTDGLQTEHFQGEEAALQA